MARLIIHQYNIDKRGHWFKVIVSNAAKYSVYSLSGMALQLALITEKKNQNSSFKEGHFSARSKPCLYRIAKLFNCTEVLIGFWGAFMCFPQLTSHPWPNPPKKRLGVLKLLSSQLWLRVPV